VTTAVREAPHHRNTVCIKDFGCKRPECRDRFNARRRAIRAGLTPPARLLIDAEPIRQHILDLQEAGLSVTRIAQLAGVAHTTVSNFLRPRPANRRGRQRNTTPETAAKILAVRPLTTIGTIRRIQALAAIGWPKRKVAAHAGVSTRWAIELRPNAVILQSHAEKIAATYDELRHLKPENNGVYAGHAHRTRERATANRWPDPRYWDQHAEDLDDLHFIPEYGVTRREIVAQEANWIIRTTGADRETAAKRLGVSKSYVEHAFRDHPEYAIEVAA
jgi:transcriptional regulator with XRE-family HTH domain